MRKIINIILVLFMFIGLIPINVYAEERETFKLTNSANDTINLEKKDSENLIIVGQEIDIWVKRVVGGVETPLTEDYTVDFKRFENTLAVQEVNKGQIGNEWHYKATGVKETDGVPFILQAVIKKNKKIINTVKYSVYVKNKYGLEIEGNQKTNFSSGSLVKLWVKDYSNKVKSNPLKNGEKVVFSVVKGNSTIREQKEVNGQYYVSINANGKGTSEIGADINGTKIEKSIYVFGNSTSNNAVNYYLQNETDYTGLSTVGSADRVVGDNLTLWLKNSNNTDTNNYSLKSKEIKKIDWTSSDNSIVKIDENNNSGDQYYCKLKILKSGIVTITANITDKNGKTTTSSYKINGKDYRLAIEATSKHGVQYDGISDANGLETLWLKSGKQPISSNEIKEIVGWTCSVDGKTYGSCKEIKNISFLASQTSPNEQQYFYFGYVSNDNVYVKFTFKDKYDKERIATFKLKRNEEISDEKKVKKIGDFKIENIAGISTYDKSTNTITTKEGNKFKIIPTDIEPKEAVNNIKHVSLLNKNLSINSNWEVTVLKSTLIKSNIMFMSDTDIIKDVNIIINKSDEKSKFTLSVNEKISENDEEKSTLYINDIDKITFTTKLDGKDVTSQTKFVSLDTNVLTIEKNGIVVKDHSANKFVTVTANYKKDNKEYLRSYKIFVGKYEKDKQLLLKIDKKDKNINLDDSNKNNNSYTLTINKNNSVKLNVLNGVIIEKISNSSNSKISVNDLEEGDTSLTINTFSNSGIDSIIIKTDKGYIYLTVLIKESNSSEEYGLTSQNLSVNYIIDGEIVGTSENKYTVPDITDNTEYLLEIGNKNAICSSTNPMVIKVTDNVAKLVTIPNKNTEVYIICRDKEGTEVYSILKNVFK